MRVNSDRGRQDPYPYYKKLRDAAPVHFLKDRRLWLVSRYEDVINVLNKPDLFPSSRLGTVENSLQGADDPGHAHVRSIVMRAFGPSQVAALEVRIRALTEELVDTMLARVQCDLVADLAAPLPLQVIAHVLDFDPQRWRDYSRWTEAVVMEEKGSLAGVERRTVESDLKELESFLEVHLARLRGGGGEGVFSRQVVPDLTDREALDVLRLLLVAGNVTTKHLIGNIAVALLSNPEVEQALRANPDLIPVMVEETLRFDSPTLSVVRRAARDVELGGVCIPADAPMLVLVGSANHTEERFPEADRFSLERDTTGHVAFGRGAHYCIGATLSRLEARIALETLLARCDGIETVQPLDHIEWEENMHLKGPKRLELKVRALR